MPDMLDFSFFYWCICAATRWRRRQSRRVDRITDMREDYLTSKNYPHFDHFLTPIPSATHGRPAGRRVRLQMKPASWSRLHFEEALISPTGPISWSRLHEAGFISRKHSFRWRVRFHEARLHFEEALISPAGPASWSRASFWESGVILKKERHFKQDYQKRQRKKLRRQDHSPENFEN